MIKLNNLIPLDIDVKEEQQLHDFLIACKQAIEEIAEKAKKFQENTTDTAPTADELEEGADKHYVNGAVYREYTKTNGNIKYKPMT